MPNVWAHAVRSCKESPAEMQSREERPAFALAPRAVASSTCEGEKWDMSTRPPTGEEMARKTLPLEGHSPFPYHKRQGI